MRRLARFLPFLLASVVLSGCGPKEQLVRKVTAKNTPPAKILVYRPDTFFHKWNPEEPYVYLDGEEVGTLGVSETLTFEVEPGETS